MMKPFKSNYEHLSGAMKRKRKRELEKAVSKLTKIDTLFRPSSQTQASCSGANPSVSVDCNKLNSDRESEEDQDRAVQDVINVEGKPTDSIRLENVPVSDEVICTEPTKFNLGNEYSTDRRHFPDIVDDDIK